jgi:hypothetical protein
VAVLLAASPLMTCALRLAAQYDNSSCADCCLYSDHTLTTHLTASVCVQVAALLAASPLMTYVLRFALLRTKMMLQQQQ